MNSARSILRVLAMLFASCVVFKASLVSAQPGFEGLRKRAFTLRNTDPGVTEKQEWVAAADGLERLAQAGGSDSPEALFLAAQLRGEIAAKTGEPAGYSEKRRLLTAIATRYPRHFIADDALMQLGELEMDVFKNSAAARTAFLEVIDLHPDSELVIAARVKIDALAREQGGFSARSFHPDDGRRVVVIDPGHGGDDLGAVGKGGLLEKDVALDIALRIQERFQTDPEVRVLLTREKDEFVPLAARTAFANQAAAELFISLHSNASPLGTVSGLETYYLDNSDDKASRALAARENASARTANGDIEFILSDLIQSGKMEESIQLAGYMQEVVVDGVRTVYAEAPDLGVKRAPFYVLTGAHMPCVLLELLFMNNLEDAKRLSDPSFRDHLAAEIASGIRNFFKQPRAKS